MFEYFDILRFRAVFSARESGELPPYPGSTVRGILGHCFRSFVCDRQYLKCFKCEKRFDCSYVKSFASTGGEGGAVNPFVIHVITQGKTVWQKGDNFVFELTLLGRGAQQPGIYLDALQSMEQMGWGAGRMTFSLERIVEADTDTLIFACGKTWMRNAAAHAMNIKSRNAMAAMVAFDAPVRIVSGKVLFESLPFSMLIRFIMGRLELIAQIYGNALPTWDKDELLKEAENVKIVNESWQNVDFVRYSMNQKENRLELPSRIGWVMYEGRLDRFVWLLEAGKYVHVGKNTTIGFGHYDVFYDR